MNFSTWKEMVDQTRILEKALGDGNKKVENNEKQSVIVQRRGAWLKKDVKKNESLTLNKINFLRPCPKNSIDIFEIDRVIGKKFKFNMSRNSLVTKKCLMR